MISSAWYQNTTNTHQYKLISEFAICHVVRHGNVNSIQNLSTATNPTMEPIVFFCHLRCRAVQRGKSQTH